MATGSTPAAAILATGSAPATAADVVATAVQSGAAALADESGGGLFGPEDDEWDEEVAADVAAAA